MNTARLALFVFFAAVPLVLPLGCAPEATPLSSLPPPTSARPSPAVVLEDPLPGVRLPTDTRPTSEAVTLSIDPAQDRFSGVADIDISLEHSRSTVWLHGKGLHVSRAVAATDSGAEVPGTWQQRDETGMAAVRFASELPAGHAKLHLEFDAPFGPKLEGLYKVTEAKIPYAFTQFEFIAARDAFPCFDEPGFKIPWDETLVVPQGSSAIANTHEVGRTNEGNSIRVHFAKTLPLPSYLVAFAVGPLDIVVAPDVPPNGVRKRPLPLRAITAKGRGKEVEYALAHTGEILATLEQYFGLEYPYDKLDILAVSDKGGAMENAGAVTFGDWLLLFDPKTAPLSQKKSYVEVMAHELAHQWVGDLVTAAWWDDIWLNEAFATWVGHKATDWFDPSMEGHVDSLSSVQGAMGQDALVSARSIRQPILSTNDIVNAFDSITYLKGEEFFMFERWVGPEVFQRGLHDYLAKHAFGSGTADDFLDAESAASGKDVKTPFHTFLEQPGVPFLETEVRCDGTPRLHLRQSRYLPLGSSGDANVTWQIPVCARFQVGKKANETKEVCTLLTKREGDLPFPATASTGPQLARDECPPWVFPNAEAAGYYRFSPAPKDLTNLRQKGLPHLSAYERIAFGNSLRAGWNRGTLLTTDVIPAAAPLATDPHRDVAREPMAFLETTRDWLYDDPLRGSVEAYGRALFDPIYAKLGWQRGKADDGDKVELRSRVLGFLALTARDPAVRAEAKKRGLAYLGVGKDSAIHKDAVDADLAWVALAVAGEDADGARWDAVRAQLEKTDDAEVRALLLRFLGAATNPELLGRARELAFDPSLRATEVTRTLWAQLRQPPLREATWQWVKEHFDQLLKMVPKHFGQTQLISMGQSFCDEGHAKDVEAFFTPARLAQIDGGPRVLASTLEGIRLCAANMKAQLPSAREFFGKHK